MDKRIVLSKRDLLRLRALFGTYASLSVMDRENLLDLKDEIERAAIVEMEQLPADVVTLDSRVQVRDVETNLRTTYQLVLPSQADLASGRVSVLAPLGTALLGFREGDEVEWTMPGGLRRLRIESVTQAEKSPDDHVPGSRDRIAA
jgi:regulator of nucleoside diphosphate kinase